jgi:N-acetyl-gamma-glutamyl-phosphate reductase
MKKKISIVGATGYTGLELVKILIKHKNVEIAHLAVRREEKPVYSELFPELKGVCDIKCSAIDADVICKDSDVIFFALPHGVSMSLMPDFIGKGKKIIDLSSDYRMTDKNVYESAYVREHIDINNLNKFVYGLPEVNKDKIKKADYIANPGCFPTSILLALYPLLKEGLIKSENIIIDSKTGVSGAGRSLNTASLFSECNESVKPYKVACHQHEPEIEQELSLFAEKDIDVIFVPHLISMTRGILSTIYSDLKKQMTVEDVIALYKKYYKHSCFVRISDKGKMPQTKDVSYTNFCDIGFQIKNDKIIIVSAIDNLIKGASGQAVQNMNIMLGFDEKDGFC